LFIKTLKSNSLADARGRKGKAKQVQISVHCYNNDLSNVSLRSGFELLLLLINPSSVMMIGSEGLPLSA
jgi:hypothetical protein